MTDQRFSLDFPYAYDKPDVCAKFKLKPDDFLVDEKFEFQPTGEGEHFYLHLRKTGENTQYVAEKLAEYFSIKSMDVGFAGMKDRQAITTQWFSCYLPKKPIFNVGQFLEQSGLNVEVLSQCWHQQKLRRGTHLGNRFAILLRDIQQNPETEKRLQLVCEQGVPNYFGEQRFGKDAQNLKSFAELMKRSAEEYAAQPDFSKGKRRKKGRKIPAMWLSAARSWLFNLQLAARVEQQSWRTAIEGDVLNGDVATAALWGRGRRSTLAEALKIEDAALIPWQSWCEKLEHSGLQQERRDLQLLPENFQWTWMTDEQNTGLRLQFDLAPGQFATAVLRELVRLQAELKICVPGTSNCINRSAWECRHAIVRRQ